eukprot:329187-Amorphochlora_amoeboformis.AAC.1
MPSWGAGWVGIELIADLLCRFRKPGCWVDAEVLRVCCLGRRTDGSMLFEELVESLLDVNP